MKETPNRAGAKRNLTGNPTQASKPAAQRGLALVLSNQQTGEQLARVKLPGDGDALLRKLRAGARRAGTSVEQIITDGIGERIERLREQHEPAPCPPVVNATRQPAPSLPPPRAVFSFVRPGVVWCGELKHGKALAYLAAALANNRELLARVLGGAASIEAAGMMEALAIAPALLKEAGESGPSDVWTFELAGLSGQMGRTTFELLQEIANAIWHLREWMEEALPQIAEPERALEFAEALVIAEAIAGESGEATELKERGGQSHLMWLLCCVKSAVVCGSWNAARASMSDPAANAAPKYEPHAVVVAAN